ncbi:TPA: 3-deoxy-D-manno-octulosonic acid transferase [Candidatus Scatenecus faecavium]|uniref:3-deoxy-D-manno-octulosonic acid transferase n=1 Tax=Candidatus Scatenecus faecavium TaxID=2840915 RepID=A0A9D1FUI7_9BACT|nr:3-deoxy-D-manno-octulosonic acid transferase [Candidatus Scatenecus faecavium]
MRVIQKKYLYGWREKLGFLKSPDLGEKVIMLHGVSVGEIIALENLTKKIKETFPDYKIVITTGTKTGQDIAHKKYAEIADFITYFPFDIPFAVNSFLNKVRPSVVLIAETELWPNFAYYCKKKNIPLFVINGRISDSTFNAYKRLKFFFKHILSNYTGLFTQSIEDRDKLIAIGANPQTTEFMGNLKFDIKKLDVSIDIGKGENKLIIAGSTHKGEDEIVLEAFKNVKQKVRNPKLLLASRHLERIPDIVELVKSTGLSYGFRSKGDTFAEKDIILLDTMGELGKMYAICDFAFIGGSFNKTGGHNPLEAAVYNKPVITGPCIHNFKDIYGILTHTNAGKLVKTPQELESHMLKLLTDKEFYKSAQNDCFKVFESQKGALDFVIGKLRQIL